MLHILSYNVHFGRKSKKLFPWLARQTDAEVICLQEFPERKIMELTDVLPGYTWAFAPSMRIFKKIYGQLTLYRTSRVILKKSKIIDLGTNRVEKALLRTRLPRTALLTELIYKKKRFVLVNPQLVSLAANKLRYGQIEIILKSLTMYRIPAFIIGDFNIPSLRAKNKLMAYMEKHNFMTDEKKLRTYRLTFMRWQLDYAFARRGKIKEVNVEKIRFSDHYPVRVTVVI